MICSTSQVDLAVGAAQKPVVDYGLCNSYICSPMNYIGGKYKILSQIMPLFPKRIRTFVDLFCGGCNVGINSRAKNIIFNDNLLYLIDLYKSFNEQTTEEILNHIEERILRYQLSLINENGYKALRKFYNEYRNPLDLFVLSAYSFNHQIRFNNSHEFNNPFGKDRSCFNPRMKRNLVRFLGLLHSREALFCCHNFDAFDFSGLSEDDFIYCDPPYLITTGTYNDGRRGFTGWDKDQEYKLLSILSSLDNLKIRFALSNVLLHKGKLNTILQEWIIANGYFVTDLNTNYANSNYQTLNKNKDATKEVLITNYEPDHQQSLF